MNIKKEKEYISIIAIALLAVFAFVQPILANPCYVYVDGYVMYCGCIPAEGLIVKIYRIPSVTPGPDELKGTDITDSDGYYRIDFDLLYWEEQYRIELWSSDETTLLNQTTILWETSVTHYTINFKLPGECWQGLTPGFWKNHLEAWEDYSPEDSLDDVFENNGIGVPLDQYTLLDALRFKGGRSIAGAERILLRAAVAAILNAAHPDINYPLTTAEIIDAVNYALQSDDRAAILELAQQLDNYNNLGL